MLDGPLPGDLRLGLRPRPRSDARIPYQSLLVVPLSAFLVGDMASAVAITTAYGAARALAVVAAVTSSNDDFPAVCDAIQERVLTLEEARGCDGPCNCCPDRDFLAEREVRG